VSRIAWAKLMRLGMVDLGLPPAAFWDLTPAELLLLAGVQEDRAALTRAGLDELVRRFPDAARGRPERME
jgi:uncharacterized phage protein (TIGR02216 family)